MSPTIIVYYDLSAPGMLPSTPAGNNGAFITDANNKHSINYKIASSVIVDRKNSAGNTTPHLMVIYQS